MSDGLDPRHGPYRGKQTPDFDKWCEEFVWELSKRRLIVPDSLAQVERQAKEFATAVVRATRDGHFTEVR